MFSHDEREYEVYLENLKRVIERTNRQGYFKPAKELGEAKKKFTMAFNMLEQVIRVRRDARINTDEMEIRAMSLMRSSIDEIIRNIDIILNKLTQVRNGDKKEEV